MSYRLVVPDRFVRRLKRFLSAHPELVGRVDEVLLALEEDPFQSHLHLHPLKGKLTGYYAVRVTYSYRITLTLEVAEQEIILLDIGGHADVYR